MMKMRLVLVALGIALLCVAPDAADAQFAPRRTDVQSWTDGRLVLPLGSNFDLALLGELRVDRSPGVDEWRVGSEVEFSLGEYLSLAPGYLYIVSPGENGGEVEHRPRGDFTVRTPRFGGVQISSRDRLERRFREEEISTRHRNRLQAEREVGLGATPIALFIDNEWFYEWGEDPWTENRLSAGARRSLLEGVSASLRYLWQHDRIALPENVHVVGLSFEVEL
ncbi:MAG: DUF2490 domain-containing protein [Gemmatimonadetes bacterium]|nr:DUF2490 domain-containing protein [Gemmatimonadota bacterium]